MTVAALDPGVAVRTVPGARAALRAANAGTVIAVLDDDPTGSQTVHGVEVVTVLDPAEIADAVAGGGTCFVLTNTRAMPEADAVRVNHEVAGAVLRAGREHGLAVELVSRSDSTLRGHVLAETGALRAEHGGIDGVLFVPAFLEAGRVTAGDTHWARVDGRMLPVGETEFARDATFGYTASDLPAFLAERSGGTVRAADVHSIGLTDIRSGGPEQVGRILAGVRDGAWVVVNAVDYADLEVVALAVAEARNRGQRFLHRCGPSWVQVLAGLDPEPPLTADRIAAGGPPRPGHGLVVVGSHVAQTSRQVARAVELADLATVELDARLLAGAGEHERSAHIAGVAASAAAALADRDVVVVTSRELLRSDDAAASLRIANRVSAGVTSVVARVRTTAPPAWVVTKGGITSHEVATAGLAIRRARVEGQLFPGLVSVLRPTVAAPEVVGMPWVVFAGNVGDADTLGAVVRLMGER